MPDLIATLTSKCFELPPEPIREEAEIPNEDAFDIPEAAQFLDGFKPTELEKGIQSYLEDTVGDRSTFPRKEQLIAILKSIIRYLHDPEMSDDKKKSIVAQVFSAMKCTDGFFVRIQDILIQLKISLTLSGWLESQRRDALESAIRRVTDEVHAYSSYYELANKVGLGVRVIYEEDTYRTPPDQLAERTQTLLSYFNENFNVISILANIDNFIKAVKEDKLVFFNYTGKNEEGYDTAFLEVLKDTFEIDDINFDNIEKYCVVKYKEEDEDKFFPIITDINWGMIKKTLYEKLSKDYIDWRQSASETVREEGLKEKHLFDKLYLSTDPTLTEGDIPTIESLSPYLLRFPEVVTGCLNSTIKPSVIAVLFNQDQLNTLGIQALAKRLKKYQDFFPNQNDVEKEGIRAREKKMAKAWFEFDPNALNLTGFLSAAISNLVKDNPELCFLLNRVSDDQLEGLYLHIQGDQQEAFFLWFLKYQPQIIKRLIDKEQYKSQWGAFVSLELNFKQIATLLSHPVSPENLKLVFSMFPPEVVKTFQTRFFFEVSPESLGGLIGSPAFSDEQCLLFMFPEGKNIFEESSRITRSDKLKQYSQSVLEGMRARSEHFQEKVWEQFFLAADPSVLNAFLLNLFDDSQCYSLLPSFFKRLNDCDQAKRNAIWDKLCQKNILLKTLTHKDSHKSYDRVWEELNKPENVSRKTMMLKDKKDNLLLEGLFHLGDVVEKCRSLFEALNALPQRGNNKWPGVKLWQDCLFIAAHSSEAMIDFFTEKLNSDRNAVDKVWLLKEHGRGLLRRSSSYSPRVFWNILDLLSAKSSYIQKKLLEEEDYYELTTPVTKFLINSNMSADHFIATLTQRNYPLSYQTLILKNMREFNNANKEKILEAALQRIANDDTHPIERKLRDILRSRMGVFSWDKKAAIFDAIITIKNNNSTENSETVLKEAIKDPKSDLHRALQIQRLPPSILRGFFYQRDTASMTTMKTLLDSLESTAQAPPPDETPDP